MILDPMEYLIVNGRNNSEEGFCTLCKNSLGKSYTREITTGLTYHSPYCLEVHVRMVTKLLGCRDAA